MKKITVDDFNISINEDIFNEAVNCGILDENDKNINYHCIRNLIRASSCKNIEDLKKFTYENLRAFHSDKEISERVCSLLKKEILKNGGNI